MQRYLLNLSYIGTNFRGLQRTLPEVDNSTVQGAIEQALRVLRPINEIELHLSSRTDAGVHALHTTVHVDLEKPYGKVIPAKIVTSSLNRIFEKISLPIIILNTEKVPRDFHCRFDVLERKYMYRLAVAKEHYQYQPEVESKRSVYFGKFKPVEELNRCLFLLEEKFDVEKAKNASKLLIGRHDFRSFMGTSKESKSRHPFFALRTIHDISIQPGTPITTSLNYQRCSDMYDYWNIEITGKSFVYRQVRRIVSILIGVANGKLTNRDVYEMLTIPSKHSWRSASLVPPHGLYLVHVLYSDEKTKFTNVETENQASL